MPDWTKQSEQVVAGPGHAAGELSSYREANAETIHRALQGRGPHLSWEHPNFGMRVVYNISSAHIPGLISAGAAATKAALLLFAAVHVATQGATALLDDLLSKRPLKLPRGAVSSHSAEQRRTRTAFKLFDAAGGKRSDLSAYARLVSRFSFEPAAT